MVEKLQQRNIGVHATIDGINDELVLFVMQNVRMFPMHGVSKMPEWSRIRVRWTNRALGHYAGDWTNCEEYSPPFLRVRGYKGFSHWCAATRGCGGTAAHCYTRGRIFSFLEQTVDVDVSIRILHWCKTLFKHGLKCCSNKKWAAISLLVVLGTNCR